HRLLDRPIVGAAEDRGEGPELAPPAVEADRPGGDEGRVTGVGGGAEAALPPGLGEGGGLLPEAAADRLPGAGAVGEAGAGEGGLDLAGDHRIVDAGEIGRGLAAGGDRVGGP